MYTMNHLRRPQDRGSAGDELFKADRKASDMWIREVYHKRVISNDTVKRPIRSMVYYCPAVETTTSYTCALQLDSPLLALPGELRDQIWKYALTPPAPSPEQSVSPGHHAFSLLFTCKQIFAETKRIALQRLTVNVNEFPPYTCWSSVDSSDETWTYMIAPGLHVYINHHRFIAHVEAQYITHCEKVILPRKRAEEARRLAQEETNQMEPATTEPATTEPATAEPATT